MTDVDFVIRTIAFFSGVYAVFSSLELFDLYDIFEDDGIMSWNVVSLAQHGALSPLYGPLLERFRLVIWARLLLGATLLLLVAGDAPAWAYGVVVTAVFATDVLTRLRHTAGLSGAYDMALVVNGGLAIATVFAGYPTAQTAALAFIAVQGVFSYSLAGLSKFLGPEWRNGEAVEVTFSTDVWGDDRVYAFFERFPWLKRPTTIGIACAETLFVLALFVEPPVVLGIFGAAVLFHVANAVFMGINGFLYIFPATYPAIYYVNDLLDVSFLPL